MLGNSRNSTSLSVLKVAVIAALLAVVPTGTSAQNEMTPIPMISGIEMLKVGDIAPDFSVQDLAGTPFNLKENLGDKKGVFIFFWSIFCEPCKEELPVLQDLAAIYQAQGIEFIGVAIDGRPMKEAIQGFINQEGYTFKPLIDELNPDESFKIADPYGVAGTPTLYLMDKDGIIKYAKVGKSSREELEKVIKQVL